MLFLFGGDGRSNTSTLRACLVIGWRWVPGVATAGGAMVALTTLFATNTAYARDLYVSNTNIDTISKITSDGIVSVFATGLNGPQGIIFDGSGNLYVANNRAGSIVKITPQGAMSTVASVVSPVGLAFDSVGNLYVAGFDTNTISKVSLSGTVSIFATGLDRPNGIRFDKNGNLFVANGNDGSNTVSKVTPAGVVSTFTVFSPGFNNPQDVVFDTNGVLYVSTAGGAVSKVSNTGVISAFANSLGFPIGMAFDDDGNLFVADSARGGNTIKEITPGGAVTTFVSGINDPRFLVFQPMANVAAPEPGTLAMFLPICLGGITLVRRKIV